MGRPKGSPNKKPYPMSASAYHQRVMANMNRHGKESSKIYQAVMHEQGLDAEQVEILNEEKINIWKKFDTPSIMLMDEYAFFKTMINAKLLKGQDPTGKETRECLKLLLDIGKEINRLRSVSADKKYEAFTKNFSTSKDLEFDLPRGDVVIKEDEEDGN